MSETRFSVDYAKRVSKCKKCKEELVKGGIRLAKLLPKLVQLFAIKFKLDCYLTVEFILSIAILAQKAKAN